MPEIYLELNERVWLQVFAVMIVLAFFLLFQIDYLGSIGLLPFRSIKLVVTDENWNSFLIGIIVPIALIIFISILHELTHFIVIRRWDKNSKIRVLSSELGPIKIPFALAIFYNEVTILQYYIVLIAPQVISIVLLLLSILVQDVQLAMLLFGLYALHLLSSAGDIYSFIDLLRRRIPLKAKIKCEYEGSKIKGERIYY